MAGSAFEAGLSHHFSILTVEIRIVHCTNVYKSLNWLLKALYPIIYTLYTLYTGCLNGIFVQTCING